ncbi:MAG: carboxypeptidase regulatory-like domain-containing protein, partial [Planctomycetales bacterium]|nr:carboxypeptidase regulatory-like domain-containing protein [Planctomycetales bacterium]
MTERRNRSGAYSRRLIGPLTTLLLLLSVNRGMSDGSLNDIKFTGKVVDPSGAPIADARIKLTSPQILRSGALQLDATTTDAQGFFSLALPSSWRRTPMSLRQELFVSAAVDGRVGGVAFYRTSLPTPDGLVIRLDSTEKSNLAAVQIVTADGQPVVDAKVTVSALLVDGIHNGVDEDDARRTAANFGRSLESSEVGFIVPKSQVLVCDELQRIQGVTDDSGKVLLPVPASQLGGVQVELEQAGTQLVSVNPWARHEKREWPNRVRLRPTGQLVGRLVHKDVSLTRNQRFTLMSAFSDPGSGVDVSSSVEVVSDVNGQFAAEDMIVGSLFIRGELTMAPEYVIEWAPQEITSGDNEFEFPIVRTVRVSGRIVDSKSQQGVASADVLHTSAAGHKRFPCDQNGRFSLRSAPGELYLLVMSPTGYVLDHRIRQFDVPERESFALPDIELSPLSTIRGIVVDESAKPVVGADVRANWTGRDLRFGTERNQEKLAKSDVAGEFIMAHVDVREGVRLTATKDGRSRILTFAESEVSSPVTMTLVENDRQSIVGKVVDQQGREVANARLHVLHRTLDKNGHWSAVEDLTPVVSNQSATQSDGSFATMPVEPQGQYQLVVRGHRFAPLRTKWLDVTRPNGFDLGTLRIEQVDGIPGSVVDTHGRPVANANVQLRGVDSTSEVLSA